MKKSLILLLAFAIGYLIADYGSNWYKQANECIFSVNQNTYKEGVMLNISNIGDIVFDAVFDQKYNIRKMETTPFVKYGEIYVPIKYVLNAFNVEYQYDERNLVITFDNVKIDGKSNTIYINENRIKTNDPIIEHNSEIFVSSKDLSKILGFNVKTKNKNDLVVT